MNMEKKADTFTPSRRMSRIGTEKEVVRKMVLLYCLSHHGGSGMCDDCRSLLQYSHARLDSCPFRERKDFCSRCIVHCYRPEERGLIRSVMAYAGPRMIWHHPVMAMRHLLGGFSSLFEE